MARPDVGYCIRSVANTSITGSMDLDFPAWFGFEDFFPPYHCPIREWFREKKHLSIYLAIIYITLTHLGRRLMEKRPKFELRGLLFIWNVFMASFSFLITIRIAPLIFRRFAGYNFYGIVCDGSLEGEWAIGRIILWLDIFVISKAFEFIDTAFIILRKQHLIFIHWYHHATVVIVCWYAHGAAYGPPNCLHYVLMNSAVHTVMYSYYALKVLRVNVPRIVNRVLTSMQISQMFAALLLNAATAYFMFLRPDRPCDDDSAQITVASSVYLSYFFLFCQFFYKTYIRPDRTKQDTKVVRPVENRKDE